MANRIHQTPQQLRNTVAWALGFPGEPAVEKVAKYIEETGECVWHAAWELGVTKACRCAKCQPAPVKVVEKTRAGSRRGRVWR